MDENNTTPEGTSAPENPTPTPSAPAAQHEVGPVVGIVIILAIIVAGGAFFWFSRLNTEVPYTPPEVTVPDHSDDAMDDGAMMNNGEGAMLSDSDELDALEEDLSATELADLDAELGDLQNELDGLIDELETVTE